LEENDTMKNMLLVLAILATLWVGMLTPAATRPAHAAPAASAPAAHAAFLDKTRFVFDLGVAYFAFHHFIWKRYQAHELDLNHKANLVKAGIAGLFAYNRLKAAYNIAEHGNSATLHKLVAPLNALTGKAKEMADKLKSGSFDPSQITGFSDAANAFQHNASGNGFSFSDKTVPVPGAS
jgi:hypothetical protein